MKKFTKADYINIAVLTFVFLLFVIFLTYPDSVFGSKIDWESQHWTIPEYFRTLFYDTKNLLPSFAFNMGGGQNIFYFSYYGLLSPITIVSYLLPFVSMPYYLIGMMITLGIASIILMYKWLQYRFSSSVCFFTTMLFVLACPIIFHLHRHIMFVDYIPFLLLGLIGVDRYFDSNKKILLIVSIFLIIMTSYFYSVGSIIAIVLYGIYKYIEKNKKIDFKSFIKEGLAFIKYICISILMASIILLPTAYVLINGRNDTSTSINFLSLIIPSLNFEFLCGASYSMGVSVFAFISLIENIIQKKKQNIYLAITFVLILVFPVFTYLLNGTMYIDSKALIPFIPLLLLLISSTVTNLLNRQYEFTKILIPSLIIMVIMLKTMANELDYVMTIGFVIIIGAFIVYHIFNKKILLIIPIIICSAATCYGANTIDIMLSKRDLNDQLNNRQDDIVASIAKQDDKMYRFGNQIYKLPNINRVYNPNYYEATIYSSTSNSYYNDFYFDLIGNENMHRNTAISTQPKNIMFNTYMGIKYLMTNSAPMVGYSLYSEESNIKTYINEDVLPIGYASNKLMSEKDYSKLKYPYNVEALISNTIISSSTNNAYITNIKKVDLEYNENISNITIEKQNDSYYISAKKNNKLLLKLLKPIENKVLFIQFKMLLAQDCVLNSVYTGDTFVTINGIRNKLSCKQWKYHNGNYDFEYAISSNKPINELNITFEQGEYQIEDISTYEMDYKYIKDLNNNVDEFIVDKNMTKGDKIVGEITVTEDGYFNTSIPYDKGFTILVDDKKVPYELIDKAFIGFEIIKGYHHIEINYEAPYLNIGKILSLFGFMLFLSVIYIDKRKR